MVVENCNILVFYTIPPLQGTLAKHSKPTLQANFAKEPFRPSHSIERLIGKINRQCLTANISKLGVSGLRKVCTFNQIINGLISKWLGNPSLLILANR